MEQKNGEIYSATESYVKYYTETGYAKKKEKEKFWRKFWKILGWTLAILALVGTLYISTIGYQQANGPLNDQCNQPIGSQQSHKKNWGSDPESDSSEFSRIWPMTGQHQTKTKIHRQFSPKHQIQTGSDSNSELGSNKVTTRPTSRQLMTPTMTLSRPTSWQPMNPNNPIGIFI
jgi:hypothetical protein